ncbi:MAG: 5-oxoprolinase subunit PxpA [Winogradskyella sp.]|uniref:5-oxoprolinase subunit PxpA n=1 Tax=Winogradskyella sp. TaxID=1883156 RepID=UPI0017CB3C69|nr:5-oxoprolinase subunit PxpA [Winogradskyella sp.]MBT8245755.1 5-oxoprolinase subunit PxpA [Winogradskyella sp.]NNK21886.1 5-oxoprolinase subunit PxpA [Winogradskyella sp.]
MSSKLKIDINADIGEGMGNEALLMPYLSSCNIACGGHAGDFYTMKEVVQLAKKYNLKVGAHPSFPDKVNFGRKEMAMSHQDLFKSLKSQIDDLLKIVKSENLKLHHVKPHGALYNLAAKDETTATIIIEVLNSYSEKLKLYVPPKSVISEVAKSKLIEVVFEGFADRNYNQDLSLVSRQKNNALITKKEDVFSHVFNMIFNQKVKTLGGVEVALFIDSICVHGDTKNAQEILKYLYKNLKHNNIEIS